MTSHTLDKFPLYRRVITQSWELNPGPSSCEVAVQTTVPQTATLTRSDSTSSPRLSVHHHHFWLFPVSHLLGGRPQYNTMIKTLNGLKQKVVSNTMWCFKKETSLFQVISTLKALQSLLTVTDIQTQNTNFKKNWIYWRKRFFNTNQTCVRKK